MPVYEFGCFRLDVTERCLRRKGQLLAFPPKPFDILALLVENSGHLITKEEFMRQIWPDTSVEDSNLTVGMSKIRRALGEGKKRNKYIETVPHCGYRFIGDVRPIYERRIDSIAVFPFDNKNSNPEAEQLSDGMTESIIYSLSRLSSIRVTPRSSVYRYRVKEVDPIKFAEKLGVTWVVSGRITLLGQNLTICAELSDVRCTKLLWGEQYHCKMSDLVAIQSEIAREITEELKLKVSGHEQP